VAIALDGVPATAEVVDPSCGGGAFLVAAAEALVAAGAPPGRVLAEQVRGLDIDPLAAATARAALRCWAQSHGVDGTAPVAVGDALVHPWTADVVIGNPPFLSPLGTDTGGGRAAARLRRALGAPYADVAALFLALGLERLRPGGRLVLVQPESLLSSRDAAPIRAAATPSLEGLWVAGEPVFGAAVRVCAPVLRRGPVGGKVRRWSGRSVRRRQAAARPGPSSSWAPLRPTSTPSVRRRVGPALADLASATAGFRDEFYGLGAAVADGGPGCPLVTCGLIDPGGTSWGARPARIGGRRLQLPTVDPDALDARLGEWVRARLVPKVLVATQTRVVEAAPDPAGRLVPLTPVLAVVPFDPVDVWRITAALLSPVVTAWAIRNHGGAALSSDAIKLSARQVVEAPLPLDGTAWDEGTAALRGGDVVACGTALADGDARLLAWWKARLPTPWRP
jgi:hypothetical protein